MTEIRNISDFDKAINHPYRSGEFLFNPETGDILAVGNRDDVKALIDEHDGNLIYAIHWEGEPIALTDGGYIEPVY